MLMGVCEAVSSGVLVRYWCDYECESGGMIESVGVFMREYTWYELCVRVHRRELGLRLV